MVADAWWKNRISTFTKFVAGDNPYYQPISPGKFSTSKCTQANGTPPLDPRIQAAARSKIAEIYKAQEPDLKKAAKEIGAKANNIAKLMKEIDKYEQDIARLEAVINDPRTDEVTRDDADVDLMVAESDLNDTQALLREAREALKDVFGSPNAPWDTSTMRDLRQDEELHWTLNKAFSAGGHDQLEKEMEHLSDQAFFDYLVDSELTQEWVLSSAKPGARFKRLCAALDPEPLSEVYAILIPEYKALYIDSDEDLEAKLKAAKSGAAIPVNETV